MSNSFNQGGRGSTGHDTNKQSIARKFGVKENEVIYFKPGVDLGGYKVIYDKSTQRAWTIEPVQESGVLAVSIDEQALLTTSTGSIDLAQVAVDRGEFTTVSGSFELGGEVKTKADLLKFNNITFRWDGDWSGPKVVPAGSTPESTGGIGEGKWFSVGDAALRSQITSNSGADIIKTSDGKSVQESLDSITGYQKLRNEGNVEGWRNEYPDDTDCINAALSSGAINVFTDPARGQYLVRSGVLYTRKYQTFNTSSAKLKRIPNEVNRRNLVEMADNSTFAGEIDGNYQDNIYDSNLWTGIDSVPFAQNLFMGRMHTSTTGSKLSTGCSVPNLKSYNGIRSCLVECGQGNSLGDLILRDSYADHWCYFSKTSLSTVNSITAGGICRAEGISFGTDEDSKAIGVKIGKITITDIDYIKFPWYELPPRYLSARYRSHENVEIMSIDITDLSNPDITDDLQIHRRVAIYESLFPLKIGKISFKTIVKNSRSFITVENNSASIDLIECEYVDDDKAEGNIDTSIIRSTGTSAQPNLVNVGKITIKGNGKGSRIAIAASSKITIDNVAGLAGATGFGSAFYAASSVRDALIVVGQWSGSNFFSQFSDVSEQGDFASQVDLITSSLARVTISGNQTLNHPGSNLIQLRGSAGAAVNRLRYFTPGKVITLLGDGVTTIQNTTYIANKSNANILTVSGMPYTYMVGLDGKAYQM